MIIGGFAAGMSVRVIVTVGKYRVTAVANYVAAITVLCGGGLVSALCSCSAVMITVIPTAVFRAATLAYRSAVTGCRAAGVL